MAEDLQKVAEHAHITFSIVYIGAGLISNVVITLVTGLLLVAGGAVLTPCSTVLRSYG